MVRRLLHEVCELPPEELTARHFAAVGTLASDPLTRAESRRFLDSGEVSLPAWCELQSSHVVEMSNRTRDHVRELLGIGTGPAVDLVQNPDSPGGYHERAH